MVISLFDYLYVLIIYHLKKENLGIECSSSTRKRLWLLGWFWPISYVLSGVKPPGYYDVWA